MTTHPLEATRSPSAREAGERRLLPALCGVVALTGAWHFNVELGAYLQQLQNPEPWLWLFRLSFAIGVVYTLMTEKEPSVTALAAYVVLVYVVGLHCAEIFREQYQALIEAIKNSEAFIAFIGQENFAGLSNRSIGYGACFGIGMGITRAIASGRRREWVLSTLSGMAAVPCPECDRKRWTARVSTSEGPRQT